MCVIDKAAMIKPKQRKLKNKKVNLIVIDVLRLLF